MASQADVMGIKAARVAADELPAGSIRFDWAVIMVSYWFVGGFYLDSWAHRHGKVDNTFFTPWHALFYAGFFSAAILLIFTAAANRMRGYSWRRTLPQGYELSLFGVVLFAAGGVGDFIWHAFFGFEISLELLLSPSHATLLAAMGLISAGPLMAAYRRADAEVGHSLVARLPMLLALTLTLSVFTYVTQFAHPLINPAGAPPPFFAQALQASGFGLDLVRAVGILSVLLQTALLMGFVLLAMRRWALPLGSLTLVFTVNGTLLILLQDMYALLPGVVITGLFADLFLWRLKPSALRPRMLRLFAFAVPVVFYLLYFLAVELVWGIEWSPEIWLGTLLQAGLVGWSLSYLVVPPVGAPPRSEHA